MRRAGLTIALAAAALGVLPGAASAAPTCAFVNDAAPNDAIVTLDATPASSKLTIQVVSGAIQFVDATGTAVPCLADNPTLSTTSAIVVTDPVGQNNQVFVNEQNGAFTPGLNNPPDPGVPEIDITLNLDGGTDSLQVDGTDNADNFLFGQSAAGDLGANLNANEAAATADATDLVASSVENVTINGRKGDDTISLIGNAGIAQIAAPLVRSSLLVDGGNQNDTLRGGSGADDIHGGTQDDELNGGGGNDNLLAEDGDDSLANDDGGDLMDGGTGTDLATYASRTNPVTVTADGVPNDGGAEDGFADNVTPTVENINGGSGDDNLTGNALANSVTGNGGNDNVSGGDANDKVSGSDGADRVLGQAGNDKLFGGNNNDTLVGGGNNDTLTGNAGKDIFHGKKGLDRLKAKDGTKDKKLNCGKGKNSGESFTKDRKDPKPKSC